MLGYTHMTAWEDESVRRLTTSTINLGIREKMKVIFVLQ